MDTFFAVISSNERDDKHFIGYKDDDDDYKIKPLHIMLPKTSAYVKGCDGETKSIFWLRMLHCWKNILIFGLKSVIVSKKLIANTSTLKTFWKPK